MKKITKIIGGLILIAVGVLFALNALKITNFDIFFDGWWTLFIIVPCLIGLFTEKDKIGNLFYSVGCMFSFATTQLFQ